VRITDRLIENGLLTREQLASVEQLQRSEGLRLDRAILRLGLLTERQVLETFAKHLGLEVIDLTSLAIPAEVLRLLPAKLVFRKRLLPVARTQDTLQVAISDAFDLSALDDVRLLTRLVVKPVLATSDDIDQLIKANYGVGGDTIDEMVAGDATGPTAENATSEDLLEMAQEASVIKLVNELVIEAVNQRASDIHVEPFEKELSIRYRIDGVLQDASLPPQIHRFQAAIVSRLKILANLNIAERRLPQDGRIEFSIGGRQIDVRVSVIPMLFGEGIVMRLLDKANVLFTLPQLGMDDTTFQLFDSLITRPHGILLVTGPTGSGKTTTLYAALNSIVSKEIKVLTVEDPVEYHLRGVNQIPVDAHVGMTFERGLRAILRHDPDVIMIGEIRDLETARAAVQASLTGHLVLSTLHTNDAASAPLRLIDMGVEPYLVASTLIGTMAQRLVRRICPRCRIPYLPEPKSVPADLHLAPDTHLFRGQGCDACRNTGFRGRTGLYELMAVTEALADRILQRRPPSELIHAGRSSGLRLLREDGWDKVRQGSTTIDEVVTCTAV
jgi:general secretion pathway protein E/type IV pilus assembly protein PilB